MEVSIVEVITSVTVVDGTAVTVVDGPAPEVIVGQIITSVNLAQGDLVYVKPDGQLALSDSSVTTKVATGFVKAAYLAGQSVTVYGIGNVMIGMVGLTIASNYFMSATPGKVTLVPPAPTDVGFVCLKIGQAISSTRILFSPETPVTM